VNQDGWENTYVEIPKLNVKQIIVSNTEIHDQCKQSWASYSDTRDETFGEVDKDFREFKRSAQKEVNYLVKEFECRKAADSYARATTARTGVLDCSKLHTYKYNEDLFRKVTTLANGKNHGLVFVLDWSGSMSRVMLDTVKQLFNLIWFCKKVGIPFEVYAFTNSYPIIKYDENNKPIFPEPSYQKKEGLLRVEEYFSLLNMLTSKTNGKTLEDQMLNIYRIACNFSDQHYTKYVVPVGLDLSGTPLNEALVALHEILPTFQKDNNLQKVQCVILTDGEAAPLKYHKEFNRRFEEDPYLGVNSISTNGFLRDRKTGNTYSLDCEWYGFTDVLLRNLRDKFPTVNFIGMRILESRDAGSFVRRYTGWVSKDYDKIMNTWKKEKTFSIKNSGYHTYFGLSATALANDAEFEVAEDATKTQIKSAFVKSLKSKKMNKKVLGEFVELVA
jgi:ribosomal protein L23